MKLLWMLLVSLLPLVAVGDDCQKKGVILECNNRSVKDLSKYYDNEEVLKLTNFSGNTIWNSTVFAPVNTVLAENVTFSQEVFDSLMQLQHLSTLDLVFSDLDISNKTNLFSGQALRHLRLTGSLPSNSFTFNFSYLSEFDLSFNSLDHIPDIYGDQLVYLNLSGNELDKVKNLHRLSALVELDLTDNNIETVDQLAFENNKELERLWLQNNSIKSFNFIAPQLHILNLDHNLLTTINGTWFKNLTSVTTLYLAGNSIQQMVEPFKYLQNLRILDLSDNKLKYLDGSWFSNTPQLEILKVADNMLEILPTLNSPLPCLHLFNGSYNQLTLLDGNFFEHVASLATLDVNNNAISKIDGATPYLTNLKKLYVAHNKLEVNQNTFVSLAQLNFLDASYNNLHIDLSVFEKNTLLRDVDLSHNNISYLCNGTSAPIHIQNMNLRNNQVHSLQCLSSVNYAEIADNPIECNAELLNTLRQFSKSTVPASFLASSKGGSEIEDSGNASNENEPSWETVYNILCPNGPVPVPDTTKTASATSTEDFSISLDVKQDKEETTDYSDSSDSSKTSEQVSTKDFVSSAAPYYPYNEEDGKEEYNDIEDDEDEYEQREEQSQRTSLQGFNRLSFKNNHSSFRPWVSWAFILLGVCAVLLLVNLVMFLWCKRRARVEARLGSDRPYEQLNNEVYKVTTGKRIEGTQRTANFGNVIATFKKEKLGEILSKFGLRVKVPGDNESQIRMIPGSQIA